MALFSRTFWSSWKLWLIGVLLLGVCFRFIHLDRKVYWTDEVHSLVRVAGYPTPEYVEQLPLRQLLTIEDLQQYQQLRPDADLANTLTALAGNAEHGPLYYKLARFWIAIFGSSIGALRLLAALISLLTFPCLYWFCLELFGKARVGWMAIALLSVSPLHVLYAQEARQYSLWTVAILASSAALLRVTRIPNLWGWATYSMTVALGLYSHLLFGVVVLSHGFYMLALKGWRFTSQTIAYCLATLAGLLAFGPWLFVILRAGTGMGGYVARLTSFPIFLQRWVINLSLSFFDPQIGLDEPLFDVKTGNDALQLGFGQPLAYPIICILILEGYALYTLCRQSTRRVWLMVVALITVTALTFALPDLISGGQRSSIGRYLLPLSVGMIVSVAYLLAIKTDRPSNRAGRNLASLQHSIWKCITVGVIGAGILSCGISAQAETWWTKYRDYYNPRLAALISAYPDSVVISDRENTGRLISLSYELLSHELDADIRFWLIDDTQESVEIPTQFEYAFLIYPSENLESQLDSDLRYQLLDPSGKLWQVPSMTQNTLDTAGDR